MTLHPFFTGTLRLFAALLTASLACGGDSNIAQLRPVTASGGTTGGPASYVTDGDSSTWTSPSVAGSIGFYYQIDLGKEYPLQAIDLYSRVNDGTNRLSRVRMAVWSDDNGAPGVERWGYVIRADGSNNLQGGVDRLTADLHAAGTFRGRFVRLTNVGNSSNAPQIAEIEVFEAPTPDVRYFGPDAGNISATGDPTKPAQAVLRWNVAGATSVALDQGIGPVAGPQGSVTVAPGVTTTYTLTATNGAGVTTRAVTVGVDEPELPPSISEFLASNEGGLRDAEGRRHDWIEIANPNAFAVNLQGFHLTDDAARLTKWTFPPFVVPGNGYAVVFASNATQPSEPFETPHTNFALSTEGEYLALVARDGVSVLTQFPADHPATLVYPPQHQDRSYGTLDGQAGWFSPPTPGAPNGTRFDGVVADTEFSVRRGFHDAPQSVSIATATPDAQIRYTLNGAEPTATTGTIYTGPVAITGTRVLRAAAFKAGWAPTNVDTQTYVFTADVKSTAPSKGWAAASTFTALTNAAADEALRQVPSMSLTTAPGVTIDGGVDKRAVLEWLDPSGGNGFQVPCGVQLFGGAFTNFAKKSFRLSFRGEYGAGKLKFPLFAGHDRDWAATDEFDQLELRNGSHDMKDRGFYMSNAFTDATVLDMGSFAPHSRFVHLYLNGNYWGVYQLRERWSADMMASYFGGDSGDYESINGNLNVGGWADPGLPYDGTDVRWTEMKALARSGPDTYEKLRGWLDVPQYVDYMLMWMFGKSEDEYRTTGPAERGHGWKFMLNDADGWLYYAPYGGPSANRTSRSAPGKQAGDGPGSFFSMLFKDGGNDYRALLADRIHRSYVAPGGAMTPARNSERLNELCDGISKAMTAEAARWNYQTPASWAGHRAAAVSWFAGRTSEVLGYYRGAGFYPATDAPVAVPAGGVVTAGSTATLSSATPDTVIYFTTDGTDPRGAGTEATPFENVSPTAAGRFHVPVDATDGLALVPIGGQVGYWPLDGNASDAAGAANGTVVGGASFVTPGQAGSGAVSLNGSSQYINLGNPAALQITGQITLAAWIKPNAPSGLQNIINKGHNTSPNGEITLRLSGTTLQGGSWTGANAIASLSGGVSVGVWQHVCLVYDGAAWRLYKNGAEVAVEPTTQGAVAVAGATAAANAWSIGARGGGGERFFNGQIDEVRLFNRGLTAAEVQALALNSATAVGAAWTLPAYDDSAWTPSSGALGFAPAGSVLLPEITTTVPGMAGVNSSVYLRLPFTLTDAERLATVSLKLRVRGDDGWIAWLNGNAVASRNASLALSGTAAATGTTPDAAAVAGETVDLDARVSSLVAGTNILALQGLNASVGDADFLLGATLSSARGVPNLSPVATAYEGALTLERNTVIKARAYNAGTKEWSAVSETFFQVGADAVPAGWLTVSELHFNPQGDDDGEFIELMNAGTGAINLRGARFTDGIDFAFPTARDTVLGPGQRLVLVDSALTFQRIQGWSAPFGGIYRGNFDNAGERVTLVAADGTTPLVDFTYEGAAPWPDEADGGGRSLVLANPRPGLDLNSAANWRVSLAENGNPNAGDALLFTGEAGADGDADGLTAWQEWALGTSDAEPGAFALVPPDVTVPGEVSLDHGLGADGAAVSVLASDDLTLWDVPVELVRRQLLPGGRVRSTWRAVGAPDAMFFRGVVQPTAP